MKTPSSFPIYDYESSTAYSSLFDSERLFTDRDTAFLRDVMTSCVVVSDITYSMVAGVALKLIRDDDLSDGDAKIITAVRLLSYILSLHSQDPPPSWMAKLVEWDKSKD